MFEILENEELFPVNLKFERPKMTTNEKIFLASMFYPLFAIASQLSPEPKSSGIEILEADTFKLHCFQTLTGMWHKISGRNIDQMLKKTEMKTTIRRVTNVEIRERKISP